MPENNQEPRQLRLINAGELDNGVENSDDDIADESWESLLDNISLMVLRSGFRLITVSESGDEVN